MSSYVDAMSGAVEHCERMSKLHPELSEEYYKRMAECCQQKLWHQLTVLILKFLQDDPRTFHHSEGTNSYLALYNKVILGSPGLDLKLNPLSLAQIASLVAQRCWPEDPTAAKAILENLLQMPSLGVAPTIYVKSKLGLLLLEGTTDLEAYKKQIQENADLLQELVQVDPVVHTAHYEMSMQYYKRVGPPEAFYKEAIQYLNYYTPQDPKTEEQLAIDLMVAALTGDGVYNLGQVVTTPLLQKVPQEHQWLVQLLQACADGQVQQLDALTTQYATQIQSQPALVHCAQAIREKMTLLALVHMVFEREAHERTLDFGDIAQRVGVDLSQVEWVVMRAFSVGLLEGTLDQVDQTVQVTWVMPRSLTMPQLQDLATRFGEWANKVQTTHEYMKEQTTAIA